MRYDTVATLAELLRIDAIKLRLPQGTMVGVMELDGVLPKKHPWSEKRRWTNGFAFTTQHGIVADGDVIHPAFGGGHWVRMRDIG